MRDKAIKFISSNPNKLKEAKKILAPFEVEGVSLDLPELQGSAQKVALAKAQEAYSEIGAPCFIEDTSLSFSALGGLPGVYIKDFVERLGLLNLYRLLGSFEDKSAWAMTCLVYVDEQGQSHLFEGKVEGLIVRPQGEGFGWDPIFEPKGSNKTYAEMSLDEKNSLSHRFLAFSKFKQFLESN